ncbi:MAG: Fur family transcriptional regulator [Deltaproteobacteria bacterium]
MIHKLKPKAETKKTLDIYLKQKRLKSTTQRDIIFDEFFNYSGQHITVEELYDKLKKDHPGIGYATVYRTLKLFTECGLAFERNFIKDGRTRYEPVKFEGERHDHLICIGCGKIVEFENSRIEHYTSEVARQNGFGVEHHKLEVYGYCHSCSGEKKEYGNGYKG